MEFNIQQFLSEMRQEQKNDHDELAKKVDAGFKQLTETAASHDKRISRVEEARTAIIWLVCACLSAFVFGMGELIVNHFATPAPAPTAVVSK